MYNAAEHDNKANVQLALSCWFLTGATASGKSQTSLHLAERLNAEIISLDSMAIYRGMDIGTAKPGQAEQSRVPHHMICLLYTSPSPRDQRGSRMPSSA